MESNRLTPSAGWTPGSKGEGSRASALWGKRTGGIARLVVFALAIALCAPMGALAAGPKVKLPTLPSVPAFVTPSLLQAATADSNKQYKVIVSGSSDQACGHVVSGVQNAVDVLEGRWPRHMVNPTVKPRWPLEPVYV